MNGFTLKRGDSRFFFVLSIINSVLFAVWDIAYIVCIFLRNSAIATAQTNMALSGQAEYTVEVTSPFFPVLRVLVYILPVMLGLWTVMLHLTDRKDKELADNKLIFTAFGADILAAVLCAIDITALHMLF
ncbi:MAG: hypothetical protein IJN70_00450 [Clostridia bacterium]|nr:hypothetical protein [Clostridia bacterium]